MQGITPYSPIRSHVRLLPFLPGPAVLDLTNFVPFGTGVDRKPGLLPAVRTTGVRMHERGLPDGSCRGWRFSLNE